MRLAWLRFALVSVAKSKIALVRSGLAEIRAGQVVASDRFAFVRLAWLRLALVSVAPAKFAFVALAWLRSALVRFALAQSRRSDMCSRGSSHS